MCIRDRYRDALSFYTDIINSRFEPNDVFILDLMLRNEGLPAELLVSDAQTGQIILKILREKMPRAIIYVVTAWNLRDDDPYQTRRYADRIFSKPCKYRSVIQLILEEYSANRNR